MKATIQRLYSKMESLIAKYEAVNAQHKQSLIRIEDLLKDMRRKEKKKINIKKSNGNSSVVNATQVEMAEISNDKGRSKTNYGENKDCDTSDDDNEFWV